MAKTVAERKKAEEEMVEHRRGIYLDWMVYTAMQVLCIESTRSANAQGGIMTDATLLEISIDGMDQAKFRLPRNYLLTKENEKLWRPQLHLVAVLVPGVIEMLF